MELSKKKKVFIVILITLILLIGSYRVYLFLSPIDSFIKSEINIYTPSGIPVKHKFELFSIDTNEYWVYKLNSRQIEKVNRNITEEYWEKLDSRHLDRFPCRYDEVLFKRTDLTNDCYICIYDAFHKEIITDKSEDIAATTSNWVIIIYDKANKYYYCIHQSI